MPWTINARRDFAKYESEHYSAEVSDTHAPQEWAWAVYPRRHGPACQPASFGQVAWNVVAGLAQSLELGMHACEEVMLGKLPREGL